MRLNRKHFLLFSEALIPVLGFFFWNWGLYFILLFYFIDVLAQEVIMHLKSKKITKTHNIKDNKEWFFSGALSLFTVFAMITLIHVAMYSIEPSIDFIKQIKLFWTYEEMGMQQGYLLIPLVVFAAYSQYRMDFLMMRKDRVAELNIEWKKHLRALLVIIGFTGIVIGLSQFIVLAEIVYVLGIVGLIAAYNLLVGEK
ncbi:MAG: hypothetical protein QNK78_07170 [Crocinitomicaceae bacterium]|uniref:Uncharacterized protein n=1 Tax=uncultured Flavobacteriia bacterium TaxID=212695 RepID=H6RDN4_9BACT|nr:hypothetical protein [Crocinitomicaceae bacterium]MDC1196194.1 hypothetical protein [Crocinitomicaceae bacterium]MDC1384494.1 hypothetical protein [Crocinitomicaceae bacterium]CCF99145.1 conserved hypothetical protein [uncultured Flavobacteriia bacterium]|tara:strand:+ start:412 stop:1005 length:594 start_codon:yes stop_codon:yes gene_type:complete